MATPSGTLSASSGRPMLEPEESVRPNKRAHMTPHACDPCRTAKKKCDGNRPCSACSASRPRKNCVFSERRRSTLPASHITPIVVQPSNVSPTQSSTSRHPRSPGIPSLSTANSIEPQGSMLSRIAPPRSQTTPRGSRTPTVSAAESPGARLLTEDDRRQRGEVERVNAETAETSATDNEHTLARIAHVMANGSVSRLPSPGRGNGDDGRPASARPEAGFSSKGDLLDKLHRHLTVVFSLRSFPKGNLTDQHKDETVNSAQDEKLFFLPTCQDGKAYINCYFEHATSTYRYLDKQHTEKLVDRFYASEGDMTAKEDTVLVLLLMATGCLWTPSWTGVDPQAMTKRSISLLRAAQRQLSRMDLSRPKLMLVQIHLALSHLYLGMSEHRRAWLALGTAIQLGRLMRLHSKSSATFMNDVDESRRQAFWSSFMMDRYLSLVLGCPLIYDERDITQPLPSCPQTGPFQPEDENRRLVGCIAHIKLSRILGHAWRQLESPGSLSNAERSLAVRLLDEELNVWKAQTPRFFHPDGHNDSDVNLFASVPPFFRRQQQLVQSAFHFINLFIYRSYLLDQFNNRASASPLPAMSLEVRMCVESAIGIARLVSKLRDTPGAKGTFWNSAYFCFASLTVLLVYLMVYEEAPQRAEIESIIEAAMDGHIQLTGSTKRDRENVLKELKRLSHTLHRRQDRPQPSANQESAVPAAPGNGTGANDFYASSSAAEWDPIWQYTLDVLGFDLNLGAPLPMGLGTYEGTEAAAADIGAML